MVVDQSPDPAPSLLLRDLSTLNLRGHSSNMGIQMRNGWKGGPIAVIILSHGVRDEGQYSSESGLPFLLGEGIFEGPTNPTL